MQGAAVVTSATTSTAEVAGDAAVLVDPLDVDAIAAAMQRLLDDPELAERVGVAARRAGRHVHLGAHGRGDGRRLPGRGRVSAASDHGRDQPAVARARGGRRQRAVDRRHRARAARPRRPTTSHLRLFVLPAFARGLPGAGRRRARPRSRSIDGRSRLAARRRRVDLARRAAPTASTSSTTPAARCRSAGRRPAVLTLHDLQPLEADGHPLVAEARATCGRAVPGAPCAAAAGWPCRASSCAAPCSTSSTSPPERGRGRSRTPCPSARSARPATCSSSATASTGPVVLYPAITYPHKEHAHAAARPSTGCSPGIPTRCSCSPVAPGRARAPSPAQIAASPRLRRQVRRLGRIPEADVGGLLELADVVAVPSRYEGFGLPALEAMAAGAAVVAADATSLPEVVGDAGRLVPVGRRRRLGRGDRRPPRRSRRSGLAWPPPAWRGPPATRPTANATAFARLYREAVARAGLRAAGPEWVGAHPSCRVGDPMGKASSTQEGATGGARRRPGVLRTAPQPPVPGHHRR